MPPNDFLSELEAAYHEHLLTAGNLGPKPRENTWTGENTWTVTGHCVRFHRLTCATCKSQARIFTGWYEKSSTPSGAVRERRIPRPNSELPIEYLDSPTEACAGCFRILSTPNQTRPIERLRNRPTPEDSQPKVKAENV